MSGTERQAYNHNLIFGQIDMQALDVIQRDNVSMLWTEKISGVRAILFVA